jgi:hypothetical protein
VFLSNQQWEFKNTQKNVLQKTSCRKVFTKNSTKNPRPIFPRFFYHVFGRFSVRGVQKHDKKYRKNKSDPTTGVTDFFFAGPLAVPGGARRTLACPVPLAICSRGAAEKIKRENDVHLRQLAKKSTYVPSFFLFFSAFLCVSRQGEFENTRKKMSTVPKAK